MPELPEVQTIVSDLNKVLPGLKIRDVWTDWKKMIKKPASFGDFKKELIGKKIIKVRRRGKNILIDLSDKKTLLIHQKMTGHMLYGKYQISNIKNQNDKSKFKNEENKEGLKWIAIKKGPLQNDPQNQFIHLVISLSNGKQLALSDLRKFAKVILLPTPEMERLEEIKNLGPEPLDKSFTFKKFEKIFENPLTSFDKTQDKSFRASKRRIKQFLMDQTKISGIGNIYSDEILWEAGIHPLKKIESFKKGELKKIYKAIKKVLPKAIAAKGDSMSDYRRPSGEKGGYQEMQNAYRMTGKKCGKRDGGIIKRIKVGGRSAHFCSTHQNL